jgi:hypothetical protein
MPHFIELSKSSIRSGSCRQFLNLNVLGSQFQAALGLSMEELAGSPRQMSK